ncbi:MAG: Dihydrofolate reductase [candidate division WS6 bacterium OLB20]|uniref:Dihydrofolate reductase n=1 Tax=candidate division WS6 bacterium OLB20 TaxID=1617426 RepID=A0A136LVP3_9BACT|nr:MAG: Dihydrofolate reductase [candidate division WS6 bacterium OLB20]
MRPKITLIMVTTADGVIANDEHADSFTWNSAEDKKHFRELSRQIGTVILGSTTFRAAGGASLKDRLNIVLTSQPDRFDKHENAIFMKGTPQDVIAVLMERGITHAALIGGANVNRQFLEAGLVDELVLTLEPRLFGSGLRISDGSSFDIPMQLTAMEQLNDRGTLLLTYTLHTTNDTQQS